MKKFSELFENYLIGSKAPAYIDYVVVKNININKKSEAMVIKVDINEDQSSRNAGEREEGLTKNSLESSLENIVDIKKLKLKKFKVEICNYPKESKLNNNCGNDIDFHKTIQKFLQNFFSQRALLKAIFKDCELNFSENIIDIKLKHGGYNFIVLKKIDKEIKNEIFDKFGQKIEVLFSGMLNMEYKNEAYRKSHEIAKKECLESKNKLPVEEQNRGKSAKDTNKHSENIPNRKEENGPSTDFIEIRDKGTLLPSINLASAKPILGKPIKSAIYAIKDINLEVGTAVIWGEVFQFTCRSTRDNIREIYSINITDYTGSITLKIIEKKEKCAYLKQIKNGH